MSYLQATVPVGRPPEITEQLAAQLDEFEVYRTGAWFALRCRQCGDRIGVYRTLSLVTVNGIALRHPPKCPSWPADPPPTAPPVPDPLEHVGVLIPGTVRDA